jgi:hypothetical protein
MLATDFRWSVVVEKHLLEVGVDLWTVEDEEGYGVLLLEAAAAHSVERSGVARRHIRERWALEAMVRFGAVSGVSCGKV